MKRPTLLNRILSVVLVLSILAAWVIPTNAAGTGIRFRKTDNSSVSAGLFGKDPASLPENEVTYADTDMVRVSILLDDAGTIEAGYPTEDIARNHAAAAYRASLQKQQDSVIDRIEAATKEELDVVWQLTLAANLISANVQYGQIGKIQKVRGVRNVVVETPYEPDVVSSAAADPNMATSGVQTGVAGSYASGYTGAGSRIAIIDTGLDVDHLSFDAGAFDYSLSALAEEKGMDPDAYIESLDLLDAEEIASLLPQLNLVERMDVSAEDLYLSSKLPFGFNYVDDNLNVTHLEDARGEHGSHVAGIAAANAYVPNGDGSFSRALEEVFVQGVAPDAQLLVMKVFGANGGAYSSDYMAAIEDAIVLGADAINLSLGSGTPGMSRDTEAAYQAILDSLTESGVVVSISGGNNGSWADMSENSMPYLYLDDVSLHTGGSPGSYTNSLAVASVDNAGAVASYLTVGDAVISYLESTGYGNKPFHKLAGEQEYVFLNDIGTLEQFQALDVDLTGKVAVCYRGETSFFEKANAAISLGAAALIVVNHTPGESIWLNLSGYQYTAPVVSLNYEDGELLKEGGTAVSDGEGNVRYWTGTLTVGNPELVYSDSPYYTMSSFSSWGVPGSLTLKPEITAPGGDINSVGGAYHDGTSIMLGDHASYELMSGTSMAAPQVAGMAALLAQYIREEGLEEKTGLDARTLAQSLLMSTAVPLMEGENYGYYYSVLRQGSGLANVGAAVLADSYILMGADATASYADGKVKAELGDDPDRTGVYSFTFTIHNLTDEEKTYALSADFFTQDAFVSDDTLYMDTWTAELFPAVTWTVDGKAVEGGAEMADLDFNGDGYINSHDGQALLDYAVGARDSLSNAQRADLNGDGKVNSYDSYTFFTMLGRNGAVVPADGSVEVEITVTLSQYDRELLAYYENGAYLEGFVYAESLASDEGVEGTSHSIPVLGFYGNWSDPSMYDKGSYMEYVTGLETRAPYLYGSVFSYGYANGLLITYADDPGYEYWFGGNPYDLNEPYMPERNAISTLNGDAITMLGFTTIRNAAAANFQVWNSETGEYYINEDVTGGYPLYSAYYFTNGGYWENTYWQVNTDFNAEGIPNDTAIRVGITAALEYYVDENGNVDWDALGEGATFSMPMVVDNEAPELLDVSLNLTDNTLDLRISDNQYIAAVALFDSYGQYLYTFAGSDANQSAGDTVEYHLDLTDVNGQGFLLQVFDYACNAVTYELDAQIGELTDTVEEIVLSDEYLVLQKDTVAALTAVVYPANARDRSVSWSSSDESVVTVDENGVVVAVAEGTATVTAASNADPTVSASCDIEVININVDMNAFVWDEAGSIWYSRFNTTGLPDYEKLSHDLLADDYIAAACVGPDGIIYASSINTATGTGSLYTMDPETYELTYLSSCSVQGVDIFFSDLTYAPGMFGTGVLLGTYGPYVIAIDSVTGQSYGIIDELDSELVGIAACYGSYDEEYGEYQDVVYLIQNDGTVIQEIYYGYEGMVVPYMYYFYGFRAAMDSGVSVGSAWYFNSAYYDGTYLYWAAFDENTQNNVTLYAIDGDYTGNVYNLGQFADSVWPVAGLHQNTFVNDEAAAADKLKEVSANMAIKGMPETVDYVLEPISMTQERAELPAQPLADVTVGEAEETVTVEITAGTLAEAMYTNGVSSVTYDPEALSLKSVAVHADYSAYLAEEGKLTFGYVALEGVAADAVVATLVFEVKSTAAESVSVAYLEANEELPGSDETVDIPYSHEDTEIRGAKEATCTEEGYTGDTYCADCGKLLAQGEVTPKKAHAMGEWAESKAPTCTEKGELSRQCADCGHTETEEVAALGHSYTSVTVDATCTKDGSVTTTCSACGDSSTEVIRAAGHHYENGVCVDCGVRDSGNSQTGDGTVVRMAIAAAVVSVMTIAALPAVRKKLF